MITPAAAAAAALGASGTATENAARRRKWAASGGASAAPAAAPPTHAKLTTRAACTTHTSPAWGQAVKDRQPSLPGSGKPGFESAESACTMTHPSNGRMG